MAGLMDFILGGQQPPQTDEFGIEIAPGLMGMGQGPAPPMPMAQEPGLPQHYGAMTGGPPMDPMQMEMLMRMLMGSIGNGNGR